ncbi:hypothetical protein BJV82DRAFT_662781 [Fennellomyces sp. T-0311]|nr:hypothetical protein BJV82DRAFT_662781 [Fennellomyces sp. T-0311]
MSFAARRLLRTNTAALRRAANTKMRTGPSWAAITVAIIGVASAYFLFGKGEADSAKKAGKDKLKDPAIQQEPGGGASKV